MTRAGWLGVFLSVAVMALLEPSSGRHLTRWFIDNNQRLTTAGRSLEALRTLTLAAIPAPVAVGGDVETDGEVPGPLEQRPAGKFKKLVNRSRTQGPAASASSANLQLPSSQPANLGGTALGRPGPPVSFELVVAFLTAAAAGNIARVQLLVGAIGMDTEVHSPMGWTPLNLAALYGNTDVVRFLAKEGADIEAREIKGQTPLGSAALNGHTAIVNLLLQLEPPAEVAARDRDGAEPVHYAAQFGFIEVLKTLLEHGANVDAKATVNRWTPLHAASAAGQLDTIQFLLDQGADPLSRDLDGRTPIDVIGVSLPVTKRKQREIQCLLDPDRCLVLRPTEPTADRRDFRTG